MRAGIIEVILVTVEQTELLSPIILVDIHMDSKIINWMGTYETKVLQNMHKLSVYIPLCFS